MNKQLIRTRNVLIHGCDSQPFSGHEPPKPARRGPLAHGYVLGGGVTLVVTTPGFSLRVWPRLRGAGQPHVVDSWMGHSGKVRRAHYLMVTEQDFADAASQMPEAARAVHVRGHQQPSEIAQTREKQQGGQEEEVPEYPRQGSNL